MLIWKSTGIMMDISSSQEELGADFMILEIIAVILIRHHISTKITTNLNDKHSIEIFDAEGEISLTETVFPRSPYTDLVIDPIDGEAQHKITIKTL